MSYIPNSIEARDVATLVHMQTNLRKHQKEGPHVITRGQGCRVFDDTGRDYIDAVAGLWCASLGFGSERLAQVAAEQMRTLGYYHLYRHRSHEPAVALAETLLKIAPVPMARVVFQCSGSEANDTAVKLAWYYWNALGQPRRTKIIARQMAYHGSTCAAVSLSGKPDMHAGFGLPFAPFKHTNFPIITAGISRARRKINFPRAWPRRSRRSSKRKARTPSPPSSPSRSWALAGQSFRRKAISRRCRRCCASTTFSSSPTR